VSLRLSLNYGNRMTHSKDDLNNATPILNVVSLHPDYKKSKRTDGQGNEFLYRAKLDDAKGAKVTRRAWDVFHVKAT
jgi:hypothetical protein